EEHDGPGGPGDVLLIAQNVVEDGSNQCGESRRSRGINEHADNRPGEPHTVRIGISEQAMQGRTLANHACVARYLSPYPCGCVRCQSHAVWTMASRSPKRGVQCSSACALCGAAYSTAGSPGRRGPSVHGTRRPVTRSTESMTSRTECGVPVPRLYAVDRPVSDNASSAFT